MRRNSPLAPRTCSRTPTYFLHGQHNRQALAAPRPYGVEPAQVDIEYLCIEEEQGIERLVLGAGRDVFLDRQVGEKLLDLGRAH